MWSGHDEFERSDDFDTLLGVELGQVDRAPKDLAARVMGEMGYRPVTGAEWRRRHRSRVAWRGLVAAGVGVVLLTSGTVLHLTRGQVANEVPLNAAIAADLDAVRTNVLAPLSQLTGTPASQDAAAATVADADAQADASGAPVLASADSDRASMLDRPRRMSAVERTLARTLEADASDVAGVETSVADLVPAGPAPVDFLRPLRFGPSSFPSGRSIDPAAAAPAPAFLPRLAPPAAPPAEAERATLGPLTDAGPPPDAEWRTGQWIVVS